MPSRLFTFPLALAALVQAAGVAAADAPAFTPCAAIPSDADRLACYDRAAGSAGAALPVPAPSPAPAAPAPEREGQARGVTAPATLLGARWEIDPDTDRPLFGLRPHNQNYFLFARWSDRVNNAPLAALAPGATPTERADLALDPTEVKFQFSFKTKLLADVLDTRGNVWFGYTQQSHWQLYNSDISRPFRETNYEPEIIWNQPLDWSPLGMRLRYLNVALNHQSNGRSDPLSRSWNRVYAELGLERGNFALLVRPWWRIDDGGGDDDNPDIERYVGRGEITGIYRRGGHAFGVRWRSAFSLNDPRGSVLADWSFPLVGALRGYVQVFSGYGESLIDYNWRQTTVGAGILLTDRL